MTNVSSISASQSAVDDLQFSGLEPADMAIRRATSTEYSATGLQAPRNPDGYVIPYFNLLGELIPYYRIKVLEPTAGPKYRAMKDRPNHIYFPPGLHKLLRQKGHQFLLITEGEKKAAAAVKYGFPCVGLSGVDNWRNRQLILPDNIELKAIKTQGVIHAKIPSGDSNNIVVQDSGIVAEGFGELIDYLVKMDMEAIIVFDTDRGGVKTQVQRAAAALGYELRYRGLSISHIRQLVLPPATGGDKVGLDDFLVIKGPKELSSLIRICRKRRIAFPRHPNPKTFVASRLQKGRMTRKETQDVALSILMELEVRGRRLRNKSTHDVFFFDERSHMLLDVHIGSQRI